MHCYIGNASVHLKRGSWLPILQAPVRLASQSLRKRLALRRRLSPGLLNIYLFIVFYYR